MPSLCYLSSFAQPHLSGIFIMRGRCHCHRCPPDTKPLHVCNAATPVGCHNVCLLDTDLSCGNRLYIMAGTCRERRVGEGAWRANRTSSNRYRGHGAAVTAEGIVVDFRIMEGPSDKVRPRLNRLARAEVLACKAANDSAGGSGVDVGGRGGRGYG